MAWRLVRMESEPILMPGVGVNIAVHRRAAGITQVDLATRIGKSVQWVSAVEQGRRHAERLTDLVRVASVVGCTVEDLIGRPVDALAPGAPPRGEVVAAVREAILRLAVPIAARGQIPDFDDVSRRVAEAWNVWH